MQSGSFDSISCLSFIKRIIHLIGTIVTATLILRSRRLSLYLNSDKAAKPGRRMFTTLSYVSNSQDDTNSFEGRYDLANEVINKEYSVEERRLIYKFTGHCC